MGHAISRPSVDGGSPVTMPGEAKVSDVYLGVLLLICFILVSGGTCFPPGSLLGIVALVSVALFCYGLFCCWRRVRRRRIVSGGFENYLLE